MPSGSRHLLRVDDPFRTIYARCNLHGSSVTCMYPFNLFEINGPFRPLRGRRVICTYQDPPCRVTCTSCPLLHVSLHVQLCTRLATETYSRTEAGANAR